MTNSSFDTLPGTRPGALDGIGRPAALAARVPTAAWNRRAVRCASCGELAREEAREQLGNGDVAVRFCCDACGSPQTRRYHGETTAGTA